MTQRMTLSILRHRTTGLLAAMSDELRGLLVTGRSIPELLNELPESIEELVRRDQKKDIRVLGIEIDPEQSEGWAEYEPRKAVATYELVAETCS